MFTKLPRQDISATIGAAMILGLATWLMLVASAGSRAHLASTEISFGPLLLHVVERRESVTGVVVSLSFETGFWIFIGGWLALGMTAGLLLGATRRRLQPKKSKSGQEHDGLGR